MVNIQEKAYVKRLRGVATPGKTTLAPHTHYTLPHTVCLPGSKRIVWVKDFVIWGLGLRKET